MIKLHPTIVKRNGKNEYVVLPHEEFIAMKELLEDTIDLLALRKAEAEDDPAEPGISIEEMRRQLGLGDAA